MKTMKLFGIIAGLAVLAVSTAEAQGKVMKPVAIEAVKTKMAKRANLTDAQAKTFADAMDTKIARLKGIALTPRIVRQMAVESMAKTLNLKRMEIETQRNLNTQFDEAFNGYKAEADRTVLFGSRLLGSTGTAKANCDIVPVTNFSGSRSFDIAAKTAANLKLVPALAVIKGATGVDGSRVLQFTNAMGVDAQARDGLVVLVIFNPDF